MDDQGTTPNQLLNQLLFKQTILIREVAEFAYILFRKELEFPILLKFLYHIIALGLKIFLTVFMGFMEKAACFNSTV